MMRDFQDEDFVVEHLRGEVVLALLGFAEGEGSHPQKLLLRLDRSGWWQFFLSAFIGHWHQLDDEEVTDVIQDYESVPAIDYGDRYGLVGTALLNVVCGRRMDGTSITMLTTAGTLVLREVDHADPHSDSELLWTPRKAD